MKLITPLLSAVLFLGFQGAGFAAEGSSSCDNCDCSGSKTEEAAKCDGKKKGGEGEEPAALAASLKGSDECDGGGCKKGEDAPALAVKEDGKDCSGGCTKGEDAPVVAQKEGESCEGDCCGKKKGEADA